MYEYAATAMGPIYLLFSTCETRIDVGPSAAPIIPIDAASFRSNSQKHGDGYRGKEYSKLGGGAGQE